MVFISSAVASSPPTSADTNLIAEVPKELQLSYVSTRRRRRKTFGRNPICVLALALHLIKYSTKIVLKEENNLSMQPTKERVFRTVF